MKPPRFEYCDPETLEAALGLLGEDVRILAGGQSLMPLLNLRVLKPVRLVDINRVPALDHVRVDAGWLRVGALARQRAVGRSPEACSLLRVALRHVGHPATRTRGTVCGSLTHNDPAAELGAVAAALDARFVVRSSRGERVVPASEWFVDDYTTCLEPDEMLVEVRFPEDPPGSGAAFQEVARRPGDFAIVGCAARVTLADGRVAEARAALCGVGARPVRLDIPSGWAPSEPVAVEVAAAACRDLDPGSDVQADAAYRREVAPVMVRRALLEASACAASV